MAEKELKWGSSEWRTHLRRSLAQRKRHGENITDIEGLIDYIEKKGPAKENKSGAASGSRSGTYREQNGKRSQRFAERRSGKQKEAAQRGRKQQGAAQASRQAPAQRRSSSAVKAVSVQKGRRSEGKRSSEPQGVIIIKSPHHV